MIVLPTELSKGDHAWTDADPSSAGVDKFSGYNELLTKRFGNLNINIYSPGCYDTEFYMWEKRIDMCSLNLKAVQSQIIELNIRCIIWMYLKLSRLSLPVEQYRCFV